jgi:hypothetical protein
MTALSNEDQAVISPARPWQIELMLGLMAFFLGFNVLLTVTFLPSALRGWGDFRQLYTGGYMVRTGEGYRFYDYDTQLRIEQKLVPIPTHLPVNHLAYEHLLFALLSLLPYKPAYLIFFALNIALATLTIKLLEPSGRNLTARWRFFVPGVVATFLPIWRALLQGQDSILLLTLLAGTIFLLNDDHSRPFEAGALVGMGLFKFQIVLPIAFLFLLWRQWRFLWGFSVSAAAAIAVSVWMVGIQGIHQYIGMMAGMSVHLKSDADVARYATSPLVMQNLRGLITGLLGGILPHVWVQVLVCAASIVVLGLAARKGPSFSLAVLAASLVSYHFIEHDASILVIPVVVALASLSAWRGAAAVAVFVGTLTGLAPQWAFLAAVPMLVLFGMEMGRPHFSRNRQRSRA